MKLRGNGDADMAKELLPLAEQELGRAVDWAALAEALEPLELGTATPEQRVRCLERARAIAGDDVHANGVINQLA